jgi:uncharacterized phage protein gp47/JayE
MTIEYGATPQGFNRKTIEIIVSEMEADELAGIATDLDLDPDQIVGQMNGVVGRQLGIAWEALEDCYNAFDPDVAEGRLLEMVSKLTGTYRRGDTASEVTLVCGLNDGVVLVPGTHFATIEDHPEIRWTPKVQHTQVGAGSAPVVFQCELLGPIEGLAGTINVIGTPITGWNSVVNPDDAELGLRVDLDPALRARRERELATIGSATVRAITANVAQAFSAQITNLTVFENENDLTDSRGLPGHSIEVLIFDGDVPTVSNNALAQVIFDSKAGGIATSGNTTASASALVNGVESTLPVRFSRASQLPVYLIISLVKKPGMPYAGDAVVKATVAEQANAFFAPGEEIVEDRLRSIVMSVTGVKDIASIKLGFAPSPTGEVNLPITIRQIGRFSTSRIVVQSA